MYRFVHPLVFAVAVGVLVGCGPFYKDNTSRELATIQNAAEQGEAEAQFELAMKYALGQYVEQDYLQSVVWLRKAAEQGHAKAQFNLGLDYAIGQGVAQDDQQAVVWYRKAAKQGYAEAQLNLSFMYTNGYGVEKDVMQAFALTRKAAEQGHAEAQFKLGQIYGAGKGVIPDYQQAIAWMQKAADQGHAEAKSKLDFKYDEDKEGVHDIKQDNAATKSITLKVPDKTITLSPDEWSAGGNEASFAKNFSQKKDSTWHKFGRIVTVFLNPMSDDRRLGRKISKTEYVEIFSVHPGLVTVQIRVDKGQYWVLCRETFKQKTPMSEVNIESPMEAEDEQLLHLHYQLEIDETRYILNSVF